MLYIILNLGGDRMNLHSLRKKQAESIANITGPRISTIKNLTEDEFKELIQKAKQK